MGQLKKGLLFVQDTKDECTGFIFELVRYKDTSLSFLPFRCKDVQALVPKDLFLSKLYRNITDIIISVKETQIFLV